MKRCVFCDKSAPVVSFSKEHVLRAKLAKVVIGSPNKEMWVSKSINLENEIILRDILLPQSPFDKTINSICETCNNGWLNQKVEIASEKYIEALILDHHIDLDFISKNRIALWASKTAAVRGLQDPKPRGMPDSHYFWIKTQLTPPPYTYVWLFKTLYNANTMTRHIRHLITDPETQITTPSHLSVINIGHMGLIILGCGLKIGEEYFSDYINKIDEMKSIKLWPSNCEPVFFENLSQIDPNVLYELTDEIIQEKHMSTREMRFQAQKKYNMRSTLHPIK